MYTWGHLQILNEALKLLQSSLEKEQLVQLYKGLRYPDFPCGSYHFDKTNSKRMIFKDNICSLFSVFKDLNMLPNYFASSYASHNGYYSVWHSMTYNPERPVYKITRDIIDQIISFLSLAFIDENTGHVRPSPQFFWLGMALHVIMDSYSPAHTLRCPSTTTNDACQQYIDLVKQHPATLTPAMQKANAVLRELKDRLMTVSATVDDDDEEHVQEILQDIFKKYNIRNKTQKHELQKTALFLYFHNHHQIRIKKEITERDVSKRKTKSAKQHPIITYFSYPQQSSWFHKINDTIFMLKRRNLYESAIHDTHQIIAMTISLTTQKLTRSKVRSYLLQVYTYLYHNTFLMAPGVAEMPTGVDSRFYSAFRRAPRRA